MALYEFVCTECNAAFTKRMPMSEMRPVMPCDELHGGNCPKTHAMCGKTAKKPIGGFSVVGLAEASVGDGPAPWDDGGDGGDGLGGGMDMGGGHGHSHDFGHGHSHGPGGHSH
ncbi:MAG: hypothetical protein ACKVVT_01885 [Dehalococcoidia bacterium]